MQTEVVSFSIIMTNDRRVDSKSSALEVTSGSWQYWRLYLQVIKLVAGGGVGVESTTAASAI